MTAKEMLELTHQQIINSENYMYVLSKLRERASLGCDYIYLDSKDVDENTRYFLSRNGYRVHTNLSDQCIINWGGR